MGAEVALCVVLVILVIRWTRQKNDEWERNQPKPNYPYNWQHDREMYHCLMIEEEHGYDDPSLEIG